MVSAWFQDTDPIRDFLTYPDCGPWQIPWPVATPPEQCMSAGIQDVIDKTLITDLTFRPPVVEIGLRRGSPMDITSAARV